MITVVYSTREPNPKYQKHIKDTIGVKDYEILEYVNNGEYSLTELYNRGLKESNNNIIIFCHDDLIFKQDSKWGRKVIKHFENSDYGILGKAGTTSLTESGRWWDEPHLMVGSVYHTQLNPETNKRITWESRYSGLFHNKIVPVVLVDGLFICVDKSRIKYNFDENIKGFHLYDIDFSIGNYHKGVKIGVIFDFKMTHKSIGQTNEQWEENRRQFVQKWAFYTDNEGNKKLGLPVLLTPENIEVEEVKVHIKKEPKVSVIIPTKSKLDVLFKCLDSFREKSNYENYKIYIADTGSSDDEIKEIENYTIKYNTDRYKLIRYDYYNFGKINNDVVKNYIDNDTELLLFCNNDIELINDALSIMVQTYLRNEKICGTLGARLHYPNKKIQHSGIVSWIDNNKRLQISHKGLKSYYNYDKDVILDVLGNTGAFLLIKKNIFLKNLFNENYIECFEDVELNLNMILQSKKNIFVGNAVCYHHESQTRNENSDSLKKLTEDYEKRLVPFINKIFINGENNKLRKYFLNFK